jgi:hypothetical protein
VSWLAVCTASAETASKTPIRLGIAAPDKRETRIGTLKSFDGFPDDAFSCRGRCFCPSCHQQRALEKAGWACLRHAKRGRQVTEEVVANMRS